MYHPTSNNEEFIELQNRTDRDILLYDPLIAAHTWQLRGGIQFDFPEGVSLPAGGRLIVTESDPDAFRLKYLIPTTIPIYGPYDGKLNNAGEDVRLLRPDHPLMAPDPDAGFVPYLFVDEVTYDNTLPWPREADGFGFGLQRIDLSVDGSTADNWATFKLESGPIGDRDDDGMLDEWELMHGLDPADPSDAWIDSDGDTVLNLDEFLARTDPNDAGSLLRFESFEFLSERNRVTFAFVAQAGIEYVIESTTSLQSGAWVEVARRTPLNQTDQVQMVIDAAEPLFNFYRIRILP